MDQNAVESEAQTIIDEACHRILLPHDGECLVCYVHRQLTEFRCNGTHRFSLGYRDATAPRATALVKNLAAKGACCCDCEIFANVYRLGSRPLVFTFQRTPAATEVDGEPVCGEPFLWCQGVRRGSTKPCGNWEAIRRW